MEITAVVWHYGQEYLRYHFLEIYVQNHGHFPRLIYFAVYLVRTCFSFLGVYKKLLA